VIFYSLSSYFHIHTEAASIWSHVAHVEENAFLTLKQKQKTVAKAKANAVLKQTWGRIKSVSPT
jgi:hypothetical protein